MAESATRRVLIAVDASETAKHAFDWYLSDVCKQGDYVYVITVPEYSLKGITALRLVGPMANTENLMKQFTEHHTKVEAMKNEFVEILRGKGIKGQGDIVPGDKPGPVIVEQARALKIDVIVMGTRGLGPFKRFMNGSVSNFVVQNAELPVVIVPFNQ